MIRYAITEQELFRRIENHKPGWLAKAQDQTKKIRTAKGKYRFPSLWSEIKDVYIQLQHSKCAFCEKRLEGLPLGRVEQDVEHFRPKSAVKPWKVAARLSGQGVLVTQAVDGKDGPGYALLAYHPLNYAMACKTCNSALKRNYFPIAARRKATAGHPASLTSEKAYLIYPIGDIDDDPETLIEFYGLSPRAKPAGGFGRLRALVTIDFFKLDIGKKRNTLMRGRAELVEKLYITLKAKARTADPSFRRTCNEVLRRLTQPDCEHTNCLRCFASLYQQNTAEADAVYATVKTFLETVSI